MVLALWPSPLSAQKPSGASSNIPYSAYFPARNIGHNRLNTQSGDYDTHFRYATARFLPQLHWRQLWAQGVQESNLDPNAVSKAGATGLMQFMPAAWSQCLRALKLDRHTVRRSPKASIICGGFYMRYQYGQWWRDRTVNQRWRLALAGYNAGLGSILRAQARCSDALRWYRIEPCLIHITGRDNAAETRLYVRRVEQIWLDTL